MGREYEAMLPASGTRGSVLPAMPTGRANARPMTGSASSGHGALQSRDPRRCGVHMDPGSAAHRHSASKTCVNALKELRSIETLEAYEQITTGHAGSPAFPARWRTGVAVPSKISAVVANAVAADQAVGLLLARFACNNQSRAGTSRQDDDCLRQSSRRPMKIRVPRLRA
jgi:hypothetical protein